MRASESSGCKLPEGDDRDQEGADQRLHERLGGPGHFRGQRPLRETLRQRYRIPGGRMSHIAGAVAAK